MVTEGNVAETNKKTMGENIVMILAGLGEINGHLARINGSIEAVTAKAHQHDLDIQALQGENVVEREKTRVLQDVNAAQGKRAWDVIQALIQWGLIALLGLKLFVK